MLYYIQLIKYLNFMYYFRNKINFKVWHEVVANIALLALLGVAGFDIIAPAISILYLLAIIVGSIVVFTTVMLIINMPVSSTLFMLAGQNVVTAIATVIACKELYFYSWLKTIDPYKAGVTPEQLEYMINSSLTWGLIFAICAVFLGWGLNSWRDMGPRFPKNRGD